ncbi:MAG: transposase [Planctomycetota bacterium]
MARTARLKVQEGPGWYHLWARAAAYDGEFPLERPACKRKLVELLLRYAAAYCCRLVGYCVMGNHWHTVLRMQARGKLSRAELLRRARLLYPGRKGQEIISRWRARDWRRLKRRLFDVSELMRNVQAAFARWYNTTYARRGRFWADRFGSTVLEGEGAVLDALLYVELNSVRAGLVQRPEDYEYSSIYLRRIGRGKELMPLQDLLGSESRRGAMREYLSLLYLRGSIPTREGQARISERVLLEEQRRGFAERGAFLKRLSYFAGGLVVGAEVLVRQHLVRMQRAGRYRRRRNPVRHLGGIHFSLREQRGERRLVSG